MFWVSMALWISVLVGLNRDVHKRNDLLSQSEFNEPFETVVGDWQGYLSAFFIQPEASVESGVDKTEQPTLKWVTNATSPAKYAVIRKLQTRRPFQDVNRCPVVSLSLFPFHEFW